MSQALKQGTVLDILCVMVISLSPSYPILHWGIKHMKDKRGEIQYSLYPELPFQYYHVSLYFFHICLPPT